MTGAGVRDALACVALAALALAWFSTSWNATFEPRDEGYLLAQSELVAAGGVPHRDVIDVYGPGVLWVTGGLVAAFDGRILPIHVGLAGVKAAGVVATYLAVRSLAAPPFAAFGALVAIAAWGRASWNLNTPYAALYALPVTQLALVALLVGIRRRSPGWHAAAGVGIGMALLFKQSLAFYQGWGLVLAAGVAGLLDEEPGPHPHRDARRALALAGLGAALVVAPVWRHLGPGDYVLQLLPLHVLLGLAALAVARSGSCGSLARVVRRRVGPLVLGAASVAGGLVAAYAAWGSLDVLVDDMLWLPASFVDYARPTPMPPTAGWVLLAGAGVASAAGVASLAGRSAGTWLAGGVAAAAAGFAGVVAETGVPAARLALLGGTHFIGVQLALLGWLGLGVLALGLRRGPADPPDPRIAGAALALVGFHLLLFVQDFPRAGPDFYLTQGGHGVLAGLLVAAAVASLGAGAVRGRRVLAALAVAWLPVWLALPALDSVRAVRGGDVSRRELAPARAAGLVLPRSAIRAFHIDELERLVAWLEARRPAEAPLLHLGNEEMIRYLSRRPALFPERRPQLFWVGWGMLSEERIAALDEPAMLRRLAASPETLVVDKPADVRSRRVAEALPELARWLDAHYAVEVRFGPYRVRARRDLD